MEIGRLQDLNRYQWFCDHSISILLYNPRPIDQLYLVATRLQHCNIKDPVIGEVPVQPKLLQIAVILRNLRILYFDLRILRRSYDCVYPSEPSEVQD